MGGVLKNFLQYSRVLTPLLVVRRFCNSVTAASIASPTPQKHCSPYFVAPILHHGLRRRWIASSTVLKMGSSGSKQGGRKKQWEVNNDPSRSASDRPADITSSDNQVAAVANTGEAKAMDTDYVEAAVAKASDFGENEMKEVDIGDSKALLVHQKGTFSAVGHRCTHYGAPLVKGYLGDGRVRCPWHGACFNVHSGDIEEFPGLDSIPCFQVRVEGDEVYVRAQKKDLENFRRAPTACPGDVKQDPRTFLLVGGGPASVACAETLRQEGFNGRIVMLSRESVVPYDRPKLSKAMHLPASEISLRSRQFYEKNNIELELGKEVSRVNTEEKTVTTKDGVDYSYDKLLLATGSKPRVLPVPGFQLENVFLLREPSQANEIATLAAGKKVVIIGTSFIGMEVAAYLSDKVASVSCIDITAVPFERVLGEKVGKMLQAMHEEQGVKFYLEAGVKEIVGKEGKAVGVTLPSGETLEADMVVAGVGVVPETDFLKDSKLPMSKRGELIVDQCMQATSDVYGAGDIVRFPLPLIEGDTNIGHWQIAHNHGRVAARNMVGKKDSFCSIPYFWTVQYGKSLRYCGHALSWDEIVYHGRPEEQKFVAYYIKDDKVLAVSSLNSDPAVSTAAELMYRDRMPSGSQIRSNSDLFCHV